MEQLYTDNKQSIGSTAERWSGGGKVKIMVDVWLLAAAGARTPVTCAAPAAGNC